MYCSNCDKQYIYKRPFMLDVENMIEVWVCSNDCFADVVRKQKSFPIETKRYAIKREPAQVINLDTAF